MEVQHWFAACPRGLEGLLLEELRSFGAQECRETVAGCHFRGALAVAYRVCLWSRLANRVLLPMSECEITDSASLHASLLELPWSDFLTSKQTFLIDFSGTTGEIRNTQYGAQVCKDAIADYFRKRGEPRPDVARRDPDLRFSVRLRKGKLQVALDFTGASLHQRGYRQDAGLAPLKENLAAALLLRADWPGIAARGGGLIDPMCGSATLLLEGAMMIADIAPGLARKRWGFEALPFHNPEQWATLRLDADARASRGRERELPEIRGYDSDRRVLHKAQANIERAGLEQLVRVTHKAVADLRKPTHRQVQPGLVICNPPYGERLGEKKQLATVYRELGDTLVREFSGWQGAVFTSDRELGQATGLHSHKRYALWNGTLASSLLLFNLGPDIQRRQDKAPTEPPAVAGADSQENWSEGAVMFGNRLRKNMRKMERWAKRRDISCYRLYDADMPEYNMAIDRYGSTLHVAEYRAPAGIPEEDADRRLEEVKQVVPVVTAVPERDIHYKRRQRQRGSQQYQREEQSGELQTVQEGQVKLLVNLTEYLDTGLFLDHRPLRLRLAQEAPGKHFLNLFCYTASASVHAAKAGARTTTSVDLSRTYLDWARKNFAINGLDAQSNQLLSEDCVSWLKQASQRYDLILLDPPTFSNSKRLQNDFDVQRDHVDLLRSTVDRLYDDGVIYFSNNLRSFKLDPEVESFCQVEDISASTIDEDFKRRSKIHRCWRITRQTGGAQEP